MRDVTVRASTEGSMGTFAAPRMVRDECPRARKHESRRRTRGAGGNGRARGRSQLIRRHFKSSLLLCEKDVVNDFLDFVSKPTFHRSTRSTPVGFTDTPFKPCSPRQRLWRWPPRAVRDRGVEVRSPEAMEAYGREGSPRDDGASPVPVSAALRHKYRPGVWRYNARMACVLVPSMLLLVFSGGNAVVGTALTGTALVYVFDLLGSAEAALAAVWVTAFALYVATMANGDVFASHRSAATSSLLLAHSAAPVHGGGVGDASVPMGPELLSRGHARDRAVPVPGRARHRGAGTGRMGRGGGPRRARGAVGAARDADGVLRGVFVSGAFVVPNGKEKEAAPRRKRKHLRPDFRPGTRDERTERTCDG